MSNTNILPIMVLTLIIVIIITFFFIWYSNKRNKKVPFYSNKNPYLIPEMKSKWGFLKNTAKGNCLNVVGLGNPNDNVIISTCTGEDNQLWKLTDTLSFIHYKDNLCLDPAGYEANKGVNVGLYTCDQGSQPGGDQTWIIDQYKTDDYQLKETNMDIFQLVNQKSRFCLDTVGTGGDAGSNVLIGDCTQNLNQKWIFIPSPKNLY